MRFADLLPRLKHRLAVHVSGVLAAAGGPPDLEELWRDFNRRLSGLFGGRRPSNGSSGGGGMPEPNMRQFGG
ncbi:MAG TPA: protease modulator HflK N-terminal domain-containing protein, partial [Burkholderiales bacterium]|nr:protease modulator HflK N-terminal domain-containing protein [Burkholderiales bacterium]